MSASIAQPRRSAEIIVIGQPTKPDLTVELVDEQTLADADDAALAPDQPDDNFDRNLAADLDSSSLAAIAGHLLDGIDADLENRRDWEDTANRAAKYLGWKLDDPTTSVSSDGTITRSVATCMAEANVKLWSVARGELLPAGGPVKVRKDTVPEVPDPVQADMTSGITPEQPEKPADTQSGNAGGWSDDQIAEALATDLNHYLTVTDKEYVPDFSKMLRVRAVVGNAFRKVYRCPLRRRPVSVWVKAQDLIVSNDCSHLSGAGRVTERIRMRQATMRRMQATGHYLDVPLVHPTGHTTETEIAIAETEGIAPGPSLPGDFEHLIYECYCELGSTTTTSLIGPLARLDRDETGKKPGYPLPYRVSIDLDSRTVLEIRRDWKCGDLDHQRRRRYVKYGFIPGDGFYDYGLIHLVGNPTQVATMVQRALTDSHLFANFPSFIQMKGPGSRQSNTVFRPNPGEVMTMDAAGAEKISDVLMKMPFTADVAGGLAMIAKQEGDVRRLAGVLEIPVGEGRVGNVPVGTIMAYLEAISQVPGAVHKDDHISQQEEIELLRALFAEDPAALTRGNRRPKRMWQVAAEIEAPDLVPATDPNTPSKIHRIAGLNAMIQAAGLPQFNIPTPIADQRKLWQELTRVVMGGDGHQVEVAAPPPGSMPPPPPPSQVRVATINAQAQTAKLEAQQTIEAQKHNDKMTEIAAGNQQRALDRDSDEVRAALQARGQELKTTHDTVNKALDRQASTSTSPTLPPAGV